MANLLLTIGLLFSLFSVGPASDVTLKTGINYTFRPNITGNLQSILWKYQSNKLVEYENKEYSWYKDYKPRGKLDIQSGELTLMNLRKNDSGLYESEIQVNGNLKNSKYNVIVIDGVPDPKVSCQYGVLICSVGPGIQADYEWTGPEGKEGTGERLNISQEMSKTELIYFCTAKNQVSKSSTSFNLKDCQIKTDEGTSGGVIAAVVAVLIICLVVGGSIVAYKKCKKNGPHVRVPPAQED
ncbi:CD48 antigen-like [Hoplias malabaricus]|uniref:CD48 antigen-like n=1 Tax=Hoplias malabaricus TaxID=27720 RepID=UPI0034629E9D